MFLVPETANSEACILFLGLLHLYYMSVGRSFTQDKQCFAALWYLACVKESWIQQ